jgi:hypothetical protein
LRPRDDQADLDRAYDILERQTPDWMTRAIRWLRCPGSRWVRIPLGLALIAGSLLAILPFFGIEMLPIGLLLLAQDIPFLRGPAARMMLWLELQWLRLRRWWAGRSRGGRTPAPTGGREGLI